MELLKLRNQITELTRKRNELTNVEPEHLHLIAEIEARRTNNAASRFPVPPGYIRRSEARWMGTGTPRDTMESFLWTVENRNFERLLQVLSKDAIASLRQHGAARAPDEHAEAERLFESYSRMPGMRIVGKQDFGDDEAHLRLDFLPGMMPPQSVVLHRVNGQWKLDVF